MSRSRYLPARHPANAGDSYPCGFLRRLVCDDQGFIESSKLFALLQRDAANLDTDSLEILASPLDWEVCRYKDYSIRGGSVTEIVLCDRREKRVKGIYTCSVGSDDDCALLVGTSLADLASSLDGYGASLKARSTRLLEEALEPI